MEELYSVDFFETYKKADAYCKDELELENGITDYIDKMYELGNMSSYVSNWFAYRDMLKRLRNLRNAYAHEIDTFYNRRCSKQELDQIRELYYDLQNGTDPISVIVGPVQRDIFMESVDYYREARLVKRSRRRLIQDDDDEKLSLFDKFIVLVSILVLVFFAVFYGATVLGLI